MNNGIIKETTEDLIENKDVLNYLVKRIFEKSREESCSSDREFADNLFGEVRLELYKRFQLRDQGDK